MAEDTEGRERRSDDLFEDLDTFFAPIRDVDWPEDQPRSSSPSEPGGDDDDTGIAWREPGEPAPPDQGPAGSGAADDEPEGPDVPGGETGAVSTADEEDRTEELEDEGEDEDEDEDDFSFMQEFLPEADESAEAERLFPAGDEEVSTEEGEDEAADGGDDALDVEAVDSEPAEITVEDLRKAPDAYRDLPGPGEGEPPAVVIEPGRLGSDEEEEVFAVRPDQQEVVSALEPDVPGAGAGDEAAVGGPEEEPPPGGVEAAAEHFAEAIRQSGELPVIPREPLEEEPLGPQEAFDQDALVSGSGAVGDSLSEGFEQEPPPRTVKVGVGDVGPSWQESTSMDVTEADQAVIAGRNIPMAFLVGLILAVVGVGSALISKVAFVVVAILVVAVAQLELYTALRRRHFRPAVPLGLAFGGLIMAAAYAKGEPALLAMLALAVPFTFLWYMAVPSSTRKNVLLNVAATLLPIVYVPLLASFLLLILSNSTALMLTVIGLTVGFDVAAYVFGSLLGGSWFGERGLAPTISPSKTWEGVIIAALIVILVSVAALAGIDPISTGIRALALALVVSVAAPLGDLAESLLKRDLGVKDMGSILPGHGGVLDRIDSLLFAAPAAFYLFRVFF